MNVRQLIAEIKQRPPLWKKNHQLRYERSLNDALWEEVAVLVAQPLRTVKVKWKTLKDAFRKEAKKVLKDPSYRPHWIYYKHLMFIFDQIGLQNIPESMRNNDTNNSNSVNNSNKIEFVYEDVSATQMTSDNFLSLEENDTDGSRKIEEVNMDMLAVDSNESQTQSEQKHYFEDEDMCFFKSLVPHVRQLAPQKKMLIRMKIQEMVYKEVYSSDILE